MAYRYGDKVIIRDGSSLDGTVGIAYNVKEGRVLVLLDREVFWEVSEQWLEPFAGSSPATSGAPRNVSFSSD